MISSEVQRTLVKSSPELWSELSDPVALARHLSEFGEIRITRVEAERTVEWEAGATAGSVQIKPSGWGTRVTLTARRELPQAPRAELNAPAQPRIEASQPSGSAHLQHAEIAEHQQPEPLQSQPAQSQISPEPLESEPAQSQISPEPLQSEPVKSEISHERAHREIAAESIEASETQADDQAADRAPRRGLLARLLGRNRRTPAAEPAPGVQPVAERPTANEPVCEPSEEPPAAAEPVPTRAEEPPAAAEPVPTRAEEPPAAAEEPPAAAEPVAAADTDTGTAAEGATDTDTEQVTAVLTSVLDRLGSAHHRPFSRA